MDSPLSAEGPRAQASAPLKSIIVESPTGRFRAYVKDTDTGVLVRLFENQRVRERMLLKQISVGVFDKPLHVVLDCVHDKLQQEE